MAAPLNRSVSNRARFGLSAAALAAACALSALVVASPAGAQQPVPPAAAPATVTVQGSIAYRERIALPPGGTAEIVLADVSIADAPASIIAHQIVELGERQPPVAFSLAVDRAAFQEGRRYAVRAVIRDAAGVLRWTTTRVNPVDPARPTSDLGRLTLVRVGGERGEPPATRAAFACGDSRAETTFAGDHMQLRVDNRTFVMRQVRVASGAKYEHIPGSEPVEFWNKGREATLTISGREYPTCRRVEDVADAVGDGYKARGNEPAWSLSVENDSLVLLLGAGSQRIATPLPDKQTVPGGWRYTAKTEAHELTVEGSAKVCRDTMSGMPHPDTVRVTLDGRTLSGCGGDPRTLLIGEWRVEDIGGAGVVDRGEPTLTFADNGALGGRACNTFGASYVLTGESLKIAQARSTMMACPPPLMLQEQRLLALLHGAAKFDIRDDGALVIESASGQKLLARRVK